MNYQLIKIGRSGDNDVKLSHASVSRHHAEIFVDADGNVFVRDLNSSNGTFVNDVKIQGGKELKPGDVVRVGVEDVVEWQKIVQPVMVEARKITGDQSAVMQVKTKRKQLVLILSCTALVLAGVGFFAYKSFLVPPEIPVLPVPAPVPTKIQEVTIHGLQEASMDDLNDMTGALVMDFKGDTTMDSKVITGERIVVKQGVYQMHIPKTKAPEPKKPAPPVTTVDGKDKKKVDPPQPTPPPANPKKDTTNKSGDRSYTVKKGDTLESIAKAQSANGCKVTADNIANDNGLNSDQLKEGTKLTIKCR
jgi:pSer/pThr/pTyr-binding forkhead associated (FHA) protein